MHIPLMVFSGNIPSGRIWFKDEVFPGVRILNFNQAGEREFFPEKQRIKPASSGKKDIPFENFLKFSRKMQIFEKSASLFDIQVIILLFNSSEEKVRDIKAQKKSLNSIKCYSIFAYSIFLLVVEESRIYR